MSAASRVYTITCDTCASVVAIVPVITSATENGLRRHVEQEHPELLPEPGFGGRVPLAAVLRHFRVNAGRPPDTPPAAA